MVGDLLPQVADIRGQLDGQPVRTRLDHVVSQIAAQPGDLGANGDRVHAVVGQHQRELFGVETLGIVLQQQQDLRVPPRQCPAARRTDTTLPSI